MRKHIVISFLIVVGVVLQACHKDQVVDFREDIVDITQVPQGFPDIDYPDDNAFTVDRWTLGKKLFFDKRLSKDSSTSCGSCHKPHLAFSDNVATTNGVFDLPGTRNAPTLTNVAYQPYYTREGGIATLEMQVLVPVQEHNEFGFNIIEIAERLSSDSSYQRLSRNAYGRTLDYYTIVRAIANFERTIVSGNSPFDQYTYLGKTSAITGFELAGLALFNSDKTNCSACHSGIHFTNYGFENNGLYKMYPDSGRQRLTNTDTDNGRFKVPTLRNIEVTGPYMHDGSLQTLEEVIEHYNTGGQVHRNKSDYVRALHLTPIEKLQLVAFLKTLTDHDFLNNDSFKQ